MADELVAGLAHDDDEFRVGQTAQRYELERASRADALALVTG